MEETPIYTELQQQLMDPEQDDWSLSAPPEFAAALAENAESASTGKSGGKRRGRGKGRRHRAED